MNCKIDYVLFTENIEELSKKNIESIYLPHKSIEFEENKIDLEKKLYYRKTNEYEFIIDFNRELCELKYDEQNSLKFDIKANISINDSQISIEYSFGDETKKLNIFLKEVIL